MNQEQQFLKAFERFADAIFKHCFFRVSDREVAKDLVQETFSRTWEHIALGKEVRDYRAFLYRIANNLIVDFYRKKFGEGRIMLKTWEAFGGGLGYPHPLAPPMSWNQMQGNYFSLGYAPTMMYGNYSPSPEFKGGPFWSGIPLE